MEHSVSIQNLAAALSKAQAQMKPAAFNAKNPFLKSDYADLGSVIEAAREPMAQHGLSVSQFPVSDGDKLGIETVLMHASGEWISQRAYLPIGEEKGKSSAQAAGSVITYLRRYSLSAVLGIYADADTDGTEQPRQAQAAKPAAKTNAPVPTPAAADNNGHDAAPAPVQTLGLPEDKRFDKPKDNGDKPKNALPRILTGLYAQIMTEAHEKGWACDKNGAVVGVHLLNGIRLGGFSAEAITDDNWEEARLAMRKHYQEKEAKAA